MGGDVCWLFFFTICVRCAAFRLWRKENRWCGMKSRLSIWPSRIIHIEPLIYDPSLIGKEFQSLQLRFHHFKYPFNTYWAHYIYWSHEHNQTMDGCTWCRVIAIQPDIQTQKKQTYCRQKPYKNVSAPSAIKSPIKKSLSIGKKKNCFREFMRQILLLHVEYWLGVISLEQSITSCSRKRSRLLSNFVNDIKNNV